MKELAILLSLVLLIWWAIQVFLSLRFFLYLRSHHQDTLPDNQLPKTAVIVYLRGTDALLSKCLRSLLNQNYPQYDLKLVIDNEQDPAWNIVTETLSQETAQNVQISPLRIASPNCSLKCSSLVQAVSELDDSYKVVASVDADVVVHSNWLRELVSPLAHPNVGATTGNCWYVPTGKSLGSLVRYSWNIYAVVQMYTHRIPWGGALAIKTKLIHQTGLLDKWGQACGEDTMIYSVLAEHGKQVVFVPSLMTLNREECQLSSFQSCLKRQLLSSRLYHPQWWAIFAESILSVLLPNLMLVLFVAALCTKQWDAAAIFFNSFGAYMQALLLLAIALEKSVQHVLRQHHQPLTKLSPITTMKMSIAFPLTQWIYGLAMISSLGMTKIKSLRANY